MSRWARHSAFLVLSPSAPRRTQSGSGQVFMPLTYELISCFTCRLSSECSSTDGSLRLVTVFDGIHAVNMLSFNYVRHFRATWKLTAQSLCWGKVAFDVTLFLGSLRLGFATFICRATIWTD